MTIQSMPDASPVKWHLAHTTWFFEQFVLGALDRPAQPLHPDYAFLFNSYYDAVGDRHPRDRRGMLSRPSVGEVSDYRRAIDEQMVALLERSAPPEIAARIELGLHHEMQHQELVLTDIKHALFQNPMHPAYRAAGSLPRASAPAQGFVSLDGGLVEIGAPAAGFAFDNERPRHRVWVDPFSMGSRLVTNAEYAAFVRDGGYRRPDLWLSEGFRLVHDEKIEAPLYWLADEQVFTLHGVRPLNPGEPVAHVSFFEAAAYAAWAGKRLPTEFEWETIASAHAHSGNFLDLDVLRPRATEAEPKFFGDVWTWTRSSYDPYPGFRPFDGDLAEYNGKFMVGQVVLRGGSCATPAGHVRASYRNFFPPSTRWQFSGIHLAEDAQ